MTAASSNPCGPHLAFFASPPKMSATRPRGTWEGPVSWRRRSARLVSGLVVVGVIASAVGAASASAAAPDTLWVDLRSGGCSDALTRDEGSRHTRWWTLERGA